MTSNDVNVACPAADCIAFPGKVRDADKAMAMLGGPHAVQQALGSSHPSVTCRPRPTVCVRPIDHNGRLCWHKHACPSVHLTETHAKP